MMLNAIGSSNSFFEEDGWQSEIIAEGLLDLLPTESESSQEKDTPQAQEQSVSPSPLWEREIRNMGADCIVKKMEQIYQNHIDDTMIPQNDLIYRIVQIADKGKLSEQTMQRFISKFYALTLDGTDENDAFDFISILFDVNQEEVNIKRAIDNAAKKNSMKMIKFTKIVGYMKELSMKIKMPELMRQQYLMRFNFVGITKNTQGLLDAIGDLFKDKQNYLLGPPFVRPSFQD